MGTTRDGTAVHACLEMVEAIEGGAQTEENFPAWLLDVLEMKADTSRRLTLVYTVGGPHVELRLGDCSPTVIAYWGGETDIASVCTEAQSSRPCRALDEVGYRPQVQLRHEPPDRRLLRRG